MCCAGSGTVNHCHIVGGAGSFDEGGIKVYQVI